jgi:hypothetical protein
MNPLPTGQNELRVKVAELCGWKRYGPPFGDEYRPQCWTRQPFDPNLDLLWTEGNIPNDHTYNLPDYPNDLDACHEMEKLLHESQFDDYCTKLWHITNTGTGEVVGQFELICATAEQRCRAFVATMEARSVGDGSQSDGASFNPKSVSIFNQGRKD